MQDLRYAARTLAKTPAFSVVAVLSLALGIGANSALFSLMDVMLLRALPVRNPQELVELVKATPDGAMMTNFPLALFEHFRRDGVLVDVFAVSQASPVVQAATRQNAPSHTRFQALFFHPWEYRPSWAAPSARTMTGLARRIVWP